MKDWRIWALLIGLYLVVKMYFCDVATYSSCSDKDLTNNKL